MSRDGRSDTVIAANAVKDMFDGPERLNEH